MISNKDIEPKKTEPASEIYTTGKDEVKTVGRSIYFYSYIGPDTVLALREQLALLAKDLSGKAAELGVSPPPITLHIQSNGGSLLAGIAAMEAVRTCPVGVHSFIDGSCASSATLMCVVAKRRYISRHAFMMIHQVSSAVWGKYEEIKDEVKNIERFMGVLREIYTKYTNLDRDHLDEILSHDLWFDAEESLKHGLVDEIV